MQQAKRCWNMIGGIVLVGLLLVACGGGADQGAGAASTRSTAGPAASITAASRAASAASTAAVTINYADIAQSRTAEGYYVLGDPNAPVVLTYYSDFL